MTSSGTEARRSLARAGRALLALFSLFGFVMLLILGTPLDAWWAHAYAGSVEQPKGDVLILLAAADDDQGYISYSTYWRARYALRAWSEGGFQRLIVSGGGPAVIDFLTASGIPRSSIQAEWRSTSTRENGLNLVPLLQGLNGRKVLMTSDFHMFRATHVFHTLGVDVIPAPVPDVLKLSQHWYGRLSGFHTLVIETAKIVDYRAHGWI